MTDGEQESKGFAAMPRAADSLSGPCWKARQSRSGSTDCVRWFHRARAQHHAACDADTEHIHPALVEIEDVGVEQRREDVLHHDQEPDPVAEPLAAKQQ